MNERDQSISERAIESVNPPGYWRDIREAIVGNSASEFETAFMEMQSAIECVIEANKENPFTKSSYLDLAGLLVYVRPIFEKHGFTFRQYTGAIRGHDAGSKRWFSLPVFTKLMHTETGQFEIVCCDIPMDTNAHSYAAAFTYGKRYALQSYLGIATADDDALSAMQSKVDLEGAEQAAEGIVAAITATKDQDELTAWVAKNKEGFSILSAPSLKIVRNAYSEQLAKLSKGEK